MPVIATGLGVLWAYAVIASAGTRELVRGPWWAWGWVLVPVVAAVVGRFWRHRPWLLALALCGPAAITFITHDRRPERVLGTPAWPIGWLLLLGLGAIVTVVARASRAQRAGQDI